MLGVSQSDEPRSFEDAVKGVEEKEWRLGIDSEMAFSDENKPRSLVFYLKILMLFRSNGSSKKAGCRR